MTTDTEARPTHPPAITYLSLCILCMHGLTKTALHGLLNQSQPLLIGVHNHSDAAETALCD